MKAISLFSGVGGFDLGFERAGIETVLQVEQDKHCLQVLERHWPNVERSTDVRDLRQGWAQGSRRGAVGAERDAPDAEHARRPSLGRQSSGVDLIYGGFPCQDVSVAGARAGLAGDRSGLWFEFERILSELRPRWAVIENVPGLLSSNSGRDFAVILAGLDKLGFDAAWAVLDAQHFGVPQRRRRVFIVAGHGGRRTEQVLSLCESCGGNPETGRAPGQEVAGTIGGGSGSRGFPDDTDRMTFVHDVSPTVTSKWSKGSGGPAGYEHHNFVAATLQAETYHHGGIPNQTMGADGHLITGANWGTPGNAQVDNGVVQPTPQGVRRLTPRECERLQGFPDDWTAGLADSHRYRMMGNAVAVPVAEWIGHRLVAVDALL